MPYVVDIPYGLAGGGSGPIRQLARYYHADNRWVYYPSYGPYGNDWARLDYFGHNDYSPLEILDMLPIGVASTVTPIVAEIISQTPGPRSHPSLTSSLRGYLRNQVHPITKRESDVVRYWRSLTIVIR